MTTAPWWQVEPPPWSCVRCGAEFDSGDHLEGYPLCPDAACSRLCAACFAKALAARAKHDPLRRLERIERLSELLQAHGVQVEQQDPYVVEHYDADGRLVGRDVIDDDGNLIGPDDAA